MLRTYIKVAALAGVVVFGFAQMAAAHGPSRKKVTETVTINAPPEKVWAMIGNFQDIGWVPGVKSTTGTDGNTPDKALRTITLANGGEIKESLYKYDAAAFTYAYRIEKVDVNVLPVNDYSSTIKVEPAEGGKSTVEWRGAFYRGFMNNDPPEALNDENSMKAVKNLYRAGLDALKAKVEGGK
jgi:hypothetical protein